MPVFSVLVFDISGVMGGGFRVACFLRALYIFLG